MLVDIGGGKTNVAIYHHGAVRHTVVVPLGGEHFTNDIAVGLRTSIPEAERLKREQGCAPVVDGAERRSFRSLPAWEPASRAPSRRPC